MDISSIGRFHKNRIAPAALYCPPANPFFHFDDRQGNYAQAGADRQLLGSPQHPRSAPKGRVIVAAVGEALPEAIGTSWHNPKITPRKLLHHTERNPPREKRVTLSPPSDDNRAVFAPCFIEDGC